MKKGAVAGAIVWSTPILMSTPAFAATGNCSGSKPCVKYCYVKITGGTNSASPGSEDGSDGSCPTVFTGNDFKCAGKPAPTIAGGTTECKNLVSGFHGGTTGSITYAPGVVPLVVQVKVGNAGAGNDQSCFSFRYNEQTGTFSNVTPIANQPPADKCSAQDYANIKVTVKAGTTVAGGITVEIAKPVGCLGGISHLGTYFCV